MPISRRQWTKGEADSPSQGNTEVHKTDNHTDTSTLTHSLSQQIDQLNQTVIFGGLWKEVYAQGEDATNSMQKDPSLVFKCKTPQTVPAAPLCNPKSIIFIYNFNLDTDS